MRDLTPSTPCSRLRRPAQGRISTPTRADVTPRTIVLDANVLMRAVLGRRVDRLLESFAVQVTFLAPEVAFDDVREHLASVLAKRGNLNALQPALRS